MSNDLLIISLKGNKRVEYPPPVPNRTKELTWAKELDPEVLGRGAWDGTISTYDDCEVELDGECPHGYKSPLLLLGYI